ncbi:exodeoxyribonuclease VII large subunit [Alkalilimnicola ehrlichii]|uniref:Exodeoxyribonuclease 7 large subunit n=1 Tax=Alkalilimnicola ehrlichii TaxID=351052 RepID=A0A3E0WP39_9GAMM|nr:exodeoxyribonuclease VII large subunit [Alkalilimnicola ehrlichii]RFA29987.1 exodeoxyribonuclease VII large subunit [Alkalilimnicola ehrlichii]RFA33807.1 exodeoxyribonuclease VII large subunit [Alkalilimnicola ehrlichii]
MLVDEPLTTDSRQVYSVSRLNREVRTLLEGSFPLIWLEGEISNLARPASGHLYFSLKDAQAQVRCAMFRNRNLLLRFRPENGAKVLVRARVSLYPARGEFQLSIEHMEPAGAGALRQAFEALKAKLDREGLFATEHKRPLPSLPQKLGVITSPSGAAIHDVLTVLRRRFPATEVLIYPVPVQGEGAAEEIAATIRLASEQATVDALLLTRGGGSLEDLWSFNEEVVARAIFDCEIPLVSAVGHEVDVTIADFVADRRAPTPSAAAELLTPDAQSWLATLAQQEQRLLALTRQRLERLHERSYWLQQRLMQQHPHRRLQDRSQRLDELEQRLLNVTRNRIQTAQTRYNHALSRLRQTTPVERFRTAERQCADLQHRLGTAIEHIVSQQQRQLEGLARALDAVSPLATLGRGYAIVRRPDDQTVLRNAAEATPGDRIVAKLGHGQLHCLVESIAKEEN